MDHDTEDDGIIDWSNDLSVERLLWAYSNGVFPWPMTGAPMIPWVTPPERGVLFFKKLHIPKSLKKWLKTHPYTITFNQNFRAVIENCVDQRIQTGTWILPEMTEAYWQLHQQGFALSCEVWSGPKLVGGIYGVLIKGVFAGESMFHLEPNTSKLALLSLIQKLQSLGLEWIDIQMVTPHLEALGAESISRENFYKLLRETQFSTSNLK